MRRYEEGLAGYTYLEEAGPEPQPANGASEAQAPPAPRRRKKVTTDQASFLPGQEP